MPKRNALIDYSHFVTAAAHSSLFRQYYQAFFDYATYTLFPFPALPLLPHDCSRSSSVTASLCMAVSSPSLPCASLPARAGSIGPFWQMYT